MMASLNNGDNCESRGCAIEGYFILNIFELFLQGNYLDLRYKHSFGYHHPQLDCPIAYQFQYYVDEICCGTYPLRTYHKVRLGEVRKCCGQRYIKKIEDKECCDDISIFDSSKKVCCNDGDSGRVSSKNMNEC